MLLHVVFNIWLTCYPKNSFLIAVIREPIHSWNCIDKQCTVPVPSCTQKGGLVQKRKPQNPTATHCTDSDTRYWLQHTVPGSSGMLHLCEVVHKREALCRNENHKTRQRHTVLTATHGTDSNTLSQDPAACYIYVKWYTKGRPCAETKTTKPVLANSSSSATRSSPSIIKNIVNSNGPDMRRCHRGFCPCITYMYDVGIMKWCKKWAISDTMFYTISVHTGSICSVYFEPTCKGGADVNALSRIKNRTLYPQSHPSVWRHILCGSLPLCFRRTKQNIVGD